LRNSAYRGIRKVSCVVQDGVLILHGRVPSFFLKQIAQSLLIRRLCGAVVIDNRLEVVTDDEP
jgi:hypothetical protein